MIELYIDNKPVVLPAGFEPEIVDENPYFTKSSSYSLDIELPVKGVPENIAVFGHCYRLEFDALPKSYPAYMRVNGILRFFGSAVPQETTDTGVKIQLLSGNSSEEFFSDSVYIDEMDLGKETRNMNYGYGTWVDNVLPMQDTVTSEPFIKTSEFYNDSQHVDCLYMPFYNLAKKDRPYWPDWFENYLECSTTDKKLLMATSQTCIQPYLIAIIKRIAQARDFDLAYNDLENSFLRHLYICSNKITKEYAKALPHWTINKLFDEIEKFCGVTCVVDSREKTLNVYSLSTFYNENTKIIWINDEQILDEFVSDYDEDISDKDITTGNIGYNLPNNDGYVKLSEEILETAEKREFDDFNSLLEAFKPLLKSECAGVLFYDKGGDRYYMRIEKDKADHIFEEFGIFIKEENDKNVFLKEVNLYGDLIRDKNADNKTELDIVPAMMTYSNVGYWSEATSSTWDNFEEYWHDDINIYLPTLNNTINPDKRENISSIQDVIEGNEEIQKPESSDVMQVALYDGNLYTCNIKYRDNVTFPYMMTDYKQTTKTLVGNLPEMSLSLNDVCTQSLGHLFRNMKKMKTSHPYTIYFRTGNKVYDPKQIFMIRNQKYVCESIKIVYNNTDSDFIAEGKFYRMG